MIEPSIIAKSLLEQSLAYLLSISKNILVIIIILTLTVIIKKFVRKLLEAYFIKASKKIKVDKTQFNFFKHLITGAIYVVGIGLAIFTIPSLRALSVSMFAGAGILAIIIGFASQAAFANLISGVMITIFKPFRVGDRIKIGVDMRGIVEDITLRHTVIRDFENKRIIIPNSKMGDEIIENSSLEDEKICRWVDFGISYDSDVDKAMHIMADEALKHPNLLDNRSADAKKDNNPIVGTRVVGFGDSSVNLRAYVWAASSAKAWQMGTDLNRSIKLRFDREGIEIPFPYRTIVFKDPKGKQKFTNHAPASKKPAVSKTTTSKKKSTQDVVSRTSTKKKNSTKKPHKKSNSTHRK